MEAKGPGKTGPRLIADLLDYDPRNARSHSRHLLIQPAQIFKGVALRRRTSKDCHHELRRKDETTRAPVSGDDHPDRFTKYTVKTFCIHCLYHFTITIDFGKANGGQEPCKLSDPENPLHHLRHVESKNKKQPTVAHGMNKYNSFLEAHRFECTSPKCPVLVDIIITEPRLSSELVAPITDPVSLKERGLRVIAEEPVRFAGSIPLTPMRVLSNLRQYIGSARQNARNKEPPRKIQGRNKLFALSFSEDCDKLLEFLDFVKLEERDPDSLKAGAVITSWVPPVINEANNDFNYDILTELSCLMAARPKEEHDPKSIFHMDFVPALKDIERSLGYHGYPTKARSSTAGEEHPHYASLGAVESLNDALLGWAYDRQRICDPKNKPYYLDCIKAIADGRKSSDLQVKVALAVSQGEISLTEIELAYNILGIDPNTTEGDEYIVGVYKSRIESAPRQKVEAQQALALIGKIRQSEKIDAIINDRTMSFEAALEFLNVSTNTASDSIEAAAISLSLEGDRARVAKALKVIAVHREDDYTLQRAAATMESGEGDSTLDVGEAYNRLQIRKHHVPDETVLSYYQSLAGGAAAGSKDSYNEALRVIALDRGSRFLLRKLDDPNADIQAEPARADEPVGLKNIGNTCYLNSLLQYLYTVRAVRDVVLNFPEYRMELTDVNIKTKKVGEEQKTKHRIVRAQRFVQELMVLFDNLKRASTQSIEPTIKLAELTLTRADLEDRWRSGSISSPGAMPNLAITQAAFVPVGPQAQQGSAKITVIDEDIEMIESSEAKTADTDESSPSSSATLVDPDLPPPYDKNRNKSDLNLVDGKAEKFARDDDSDTMPELMDTDQNGNDTLPVIEQIDGDEKSAVPPVPPRNKANLSIQTQGTEKTKTRSDDNALMNFGAQQDVTEVIENVIDQLRSAIRATSIDPSNGEQLDEVRDTFYGDIAYYLRKGRKIQSFSTLISFPHERHPRNLYEALDITFDEQLIDFEEVKTPSFASIISLPPILQIQIQRTQYNSELKTMGKNQSPVTFPETFYMDRYMDASHDSPLMRRRRETWTWKKELGRLEARADALRSTSTDTSNLTVHDALSATTEYISALDTELSTSDLVVPPTLPSMLTSRLSEISTELLQLDSRIAVLKQRLNEQFTDLVQEEYKLHSVFIHRGSDAAGGHYWIYIYDFENDVWREYNDEYVTVVTDRRRIFEGRDYIDGTPYYLTYVRSRDKMALVDAVVRDVVPQEVPMTQREGMKETEGLEKARSWGEEGGQNADADTVMMNGTQGAAELDGAETQVRIREGEDKLLVTESTPTWRGAANGSTSNGLGGQW